MRVKEVIEMLNRYPADEEICVAWWDKATFDTDEEELSLEQWGEVVAEFDANEGFGHINEQVYNILWGLAFEA